MFSKLRKKPVLVWLIYSNGIKAKMAMPSFKDVKKALCGPTKYNKWMESDDITRPIRGFLLTKLITKTGKVIEIELTEQWIGGFNE